MDVQSATPTGGGGLAEDHHDFTFTDGISLSVDCPTQEEIDYYWEKLSEGGEKRVCGWLSDRFGVRWQVNPRRLLEMLGDPDAERAGRVMEAMREMTKIEIPEMEQAYEGR